MNHSDDQISSDMASEVLAEAARLHITAKQGYSLRDLEQAGLETEIPPETIRRAVKIVEERRRIQQVKQQRRWRNLKQLIRTSANTGILILIFAASISFPFILSPFLHKVEEWISYPLQGPKNHSSSDEVRLMDVSGTANPLTLVSVTSTTIHGNFTSSKACDYAAVNFSLLDRAGRVIDTTGTNHRDLPSGKIWRFEVNSFEKASAYEIGGVKCTNYEQEQAEWEAKLQKQLAEREAERQRQQAEWEAERQRQQAEWEAESQKRQAEWEAKFQKQREEWQLRRLH